MSHQFSQGISVREILMIYLTGLLVVSFWPEKVASTTFVNISKSIEIRIDESSPVLAAEKDLLSFQKTTNSISQTRLMNLNQQIRKAPSIQAVQLADYSKDLKEIHNPNRILLVGPLQLNQGLALTDENRIEVVREWQGQVLERGDVNLGSGTYSIEIGKLEGTLCAKLTGDRYEIMGKGCISLDQYRKLNRTLASGPLLNVSKSQDIAVLAESLRSVEVASQLLPMIDTPKYKPSVSHKIYNYYDSDQADPPVLEGATVGNSVDNLEDETSYIIAQIQAAGYIPARVVSGARTSKRGVPLVSQNAAVALNGIARDAGYTDSDTMTRGLVFGRVKKEGRTVAGVDVQIEGRPDLKPLYFNELYIPDPNQKETASHGLYTFMNVPDGEYALRAEMANKFVGFQNASVRSGAMALADIDSTFRKREVQLTAYDIITKVSQPAVLTLQAYSEDVILESGQADILLSEIEDNSFVFVHPVNRNYLTTQFVLEAGDSQYNFPMIHKDWMENLLSQAKLNHSVQGRIVMGFGPQEPFKAIAVGSQSARIVYFDHQGKVVEGDFGPADGGYLILDPEEDVVEFAIERPSQKSLKVVYMPTQPGVVNILTVPGTFSHSGSPVIGQR